MGMQEEAQQSREEKAMISTIQNERLTVQVSDEGAELQSILSSDGIQYLWQGDPEIWRGHGPNIFPYVARLTDGRYTLGGKTYEMKIHGLIKYSTLFVEESSGTDITFRLDSNEETKKHYPADFTYRIRYALDGNRLDVTLLVDNRGSERMYFGIGGHPGFNVPLDQGLEFEDYYLEFSHECHPTKIGFTGDCFLDDENAVCPLEGNRRIRLHHDLFDNDAVVLEHVDHRVSIRSDKGRHAVTVSFPDFRYVGFWHAVRKEAPYVCIEPWSSLPSRKGIVEDLSQQADLIRLEPGRQYVNRWSMEFD